MMYSFSIYKLSYPLKANDKGIDLKHFADRVGLTSISIGDNIHFTDIWLMKPPPLHFGHRGIYSTVTNKVNLH